MTWFKSWFDSPHYHLLYDRRDQAEADDFIANMTRFLKISSGRVLDNSCGRGRHVEALARRGFEVWGTDLSANSLKAFASSKYNNVQLEIWDMRQCYKPAFFDVVINIFTSFGYFEEPMDNLKAIEAVACNLKPNGYFVQDYLNAESFRSVSGIEVHEIIRNGIKFKISKSIEGKRLIKNIEFDEDSVHYNFREDVEMLYLSDFKDLYDQTGLELISVFGNYKMEALEPDSDRLIMISRKKSEHGN
jgi:SAM-dependent methyltransferase